MASGQVGGASEAVVVEFTLPSDAFPFGRAVGADPDVKVWIEPFVPLGEGRFPFLWAHDEDFEPFERTLRDSDLVLALEALARIDDSVLYRVEWADQGATFLNGILAAGGTILEAQGDSLWSFVVRFSDHGALTKFHRFYQDEGYPVTIEQVSALSTEPGQQFGWALTPAQRRAVLLALENGYFSVPRETKLEEIADELGITRQAASELVRRGTETILRKALVGFSAADFLDDAPAED
ncbi:MAG: helix-turn-helix domain-containing protein [Haloarculaceae archaeon]